MSVEKLTQAEANRLLKMIKRSLIAEMYFPGKGDTKEFDVIGDTKKDVFSISIFRGRIKGIKYYVGARIKKNGVILLALHVNPSSIHCNPDGKRITGNHWHVYREGYGHSFAFSAKDIENEAFIENTIAFLIELNVVERPEIFYQTELV